MQHRPSMSANFALNELPLEEPTGVVERHTVEKLLAINMRGGVHRSSPFDRGGYDSIRVNRDRCHAVMCLNLYAV